VIEKTAKIFSILICRGPESQFITKFDCHSTPCLPDEVQECL